MSSFSFKKFNPYCTFSVKASPSINTKALNLNTPNFLSTDIAKIYNFPPPVTSQIVIGVISLGGGLFGSVASNGILTGGDVQNYWTSLKITNQPKVIIVPIDGAVNNPAGDLNSTIENTIDVETIGACCPGSNVTIIFYLGLNTFSSFYNAFNKAINTSIVINNVSLKPSVISCSWGTPEANLDFNTLKNFNLMFQNAKNAGINICCASGDNGSSDGLTGLNVDFPASSPNLIACGGTSLTCNDLVYNNNTVETTWTGSGGGFSKTFPSPIYQAQLFQNYRAVPDLALNADPNTGVIYLINGTNYILGGTSIVAPAVAAFIGCLNINYSFLNKLYALNSMAFHDIVTGTNVGFKAQSGYDNCTGLGSFNGQDIKNELKDWVAVSSINVTSYSNIVSVKNTLQVSANILPANSTNTYIGWKSSNTSIATVSKTGLITGVKIGSVAITAIAYDSTNGLISSNYSVTVIAEPFVALTSISLAPLALPLPLILNINQSFTAIMAFTPANATNKTLTWTSSSLNVANVNASGLITGLTNGTCIITARSSAGLTALINVTVQTPPAAISLNVSIHVSQTFTLIPTIQPDNASNKTVTWSSSNSNVATVSNGLITGISAGLCTIQVLTSNNITCSWIISIV